MANDGATMADAPEEIRARLADRLGIETDPLAILSIAAETIGRGLGVSRCGYGEIEPGGDLYTIRCEWADDVPSMVGTHPLLRESEFVQAYERGETAAVDDVDELDLPQAAHDSLATLSSRAFVCVPLLSDGVLIGLFAAHHHSPRHWKAGEVTLIAQVATMTWSALRHARAIAKLRERDASQAFLIDWSDALRHAGEPDAIMATTVERLGRHVAATRVTYSEGDDTRRIFTTRWNWCDGCDSLIGLRVALDALPPDVQREWLAGDVVRYDDVAGDPRVPPEHLARYIERDIRAFVSIPLIREGEVRSILSVQSNSPRYWQDSDVALIRDVGERTWVALERARAEAELRDRDRNQRFLIDWADSVRGETAPAAILDTTLERLANHLDASRAAYAQIDIAGGAYIVTNEWRRQVVPTLGHAWPAANLSAAVRETYLAGEALVSDALAIDPRFSEAARDAFAASDVAARVGVPLLRGDVVYAVLSIDSDRPRPWAAAEVALIREISDRMWVLLHRAQAEASLKQRERDQTFLIAWSDRVRAETSPRAILATTLSMVGEHLGTARANYAESVPDAAALEVLQEWCDGIVSVVGQNFPLAALGDTILAAHLTGEPVVVASVATDARFDDASRPLYASVGVAAFVSVPMVRNGAMEAVLSVQSHAPRDWSASEVQLLRDVADRTWAVLERARSEERMADSEALLTAFMENAPLGMHLKDANGRYLRMNRELARQIDIPVDTVLGRIPGEFLPPETARAVIDLEQRALAGNVASTEFHFPDRTDYAALLAIVFPISGPRGIARTGGFTLDLTARKAAEVALERSREALYQSEKLTALGSLLAGVSHELNNPLSIVVAQAVMMERQAKGTEVAERAFKIRKAADRCARIVQTFLAMARQKQPERQAVDLNQVVEAALELAGYGLRTDGIAVDLQLAADLPQIAADADQLHQIVINLIVNAQHAMLAVDGERRLTLSTAVGPEPQTVIFDIADTGPGVPEDVARRIFEPFFTTKGQSEGTGLGLSFSQGLAEAHGGRLALTASERGACFRLTLPIEADHVLPRVSPADQRHAVPTVRRHALLIDDEEEIAESLADFLAFEGYDAEIATSGAAACALVAARSFDIIVSDLRMPGMDGPALHAWLVREHPQLGDRIGFVTGDTLGTAVARFLAEAKRPVLEKPFSPETVRDFLREMNDGRRG